VTALITVLIFLGTFLVLVLAHESGHFWAAKLAGVTVKEFAIGFGPKLVSHQGRETRYSLRIIPVGGYVRLAGEDREEASPDIPFDRILYNKPPAVRALISLAGPAANLFTTFFVLVIVMWAFGVPFVQVGDTMAGMPAEDVLLPGDRLLAAEGEQVYSAEDLDRVVQRSQGSPITLLIERDDQRQRIEISPRFEPTENRYLVGIYPSGVTFTTTLAAVEPGSVFEAGGLRTGDVIETVEGTPVRAGIGLVVFINDLLPTDSIALGIVRAGEPMQVSLSTSGLDLDQTLAGATFDDTGLHYRRAGFARGIALGAGQFANYVRLIVQWIRGMIAGQIAPSETIAGPIGIAQLLGTWARQGMNVFLQIFSYLSLSLGFLNLIPFPALDGSRAAFALYELVRRKPIPPQREGFIHTIGFLILIAVMVLVTYRDILRLFR
jgi:regulator of sigma E protease